MPTPIRVISNSQLKIKKMSNNTNTKKLSAYTIAANCSDLSDVNAGIEELKDYFNACERQGKKPSNTAYIRLNKLGQKRNKLSK